MKRLLLTTVIFFLLAAFAGAQTQTQADLSGTSEVPPNNSTATGHVTATLDANMLIIDGSFSGLTSMIHETGGSSAHIHRGAVGENGPIVFNLNVTSSDNVSGTFDLATVLSNEQISDFNAGLYYVNVHSELYPGGEIRGQLILDEETDDTGTTQDQAVTYRVTIENLMPWQPLSPFVAATMGDGEDIFEVGQTASSQIETIAESGDNTPLANLFNTLDSTDVVNVATPLKGAQTNDDTVTFTITANQGDKIWLASMIVCTNDGFTGLNGANLPESGTLTYDLQSYDAGSEDNTELSSDIPDGCNELGPVTFPNDGDNEASIDSTDEIQAHGGLEFNGNLTSNHSWTDPVARVTITRVDTGGQNNITETNITTTSNGTSVDLNIHRWYPKGPDYVFMCNSTGFDLANARYTWFYGDGHKLLNIVNQNTYHVYTALGTYTVSCTVDDGVRTGTDSITVTVTDLTRPTSPLFANQTNVTAAPSQTNETSVNATTNITVCIPVNMTVSGNSTQ